MSQPRSLAQRRLPSIITATCWGIFMRLDAQSSGFGEIFAAGALRFGRQNATPNRPLRNFLPHGCWLRDCWLRALNTWTLMTFVVSQKNADWSKTLFVFSISRAPSTISILSTFSMAVQVLAAGFFIKIKIKVATTQTRAQSPARSRNLPSSGRTDAFFTLGIFRGAEVSRAARFQ